MNREDVKGNNEQGEGEKTVNQKIAENQRPRIQRKLRGQNWQIFSCNFITNICNICLYFPPKSMYEYLQPINQPLPPLFSAIFIFF